MLFRTLVLIILLLTPTACAAASPIQPGPAQTLAARAWQADQHVVWELDWPAAPVGGVVTVETWRAGEQYRLEILEAVAPALVGETLVYNGHTTWLYNRFAGAAPSTPDLPRLSPVTDAFAVINRFLTQPPQAATQELVRLDSGPAQKISLIFENGDHLILWRDEKTGLPGRILFSVKGQQATLKARSLEPLLNPPEGLFQPVR